LLFKFPTGFFKEGFIFLRRHEWKQLKILLININLKYSTLSVLYRSENYTRLSVNSLFLFIYCNRLGHLWVSIYLMLNVQSDLNDLFKHLFTNIGAVLGSLSSRQFHTKMKTSDRIGPHNSDVISLLVGCLLGDGYAYQTKGKIIETSFR